MRPSQLVRVEFRRVRRKEEQFNAILMLFDELPDQLSFVGRMSIDDEEDLAVHSSDETLEEVAERMSRYRPFLNHEAKMAQSIDRRQHVERETRSRRLHDRRLPLGRPGGSAMMIRANPRFVRKEDERAFLLGTGCNSRELLFAPLLDQHGILLPRSIQGALGREAQLLHQAPYRGLTELDTKFPEDQLPNHAQGPKSKLKLQLKRVLGPQKAGELRQLLASQFRRCTRDRLGFERLNPAGVVRRNPAIDGPSIDAQPGCNSFRAFSGLDPFYGSDPHFFQCLVGVCSSVDRLLTLHVASIRHEVLLPPVSVTVLRLEPLTEEDIAVIAAQTLGNPEDFIHQARARGIFDWLQNPQSLGLILKVVGRGNWPEMKTELYEKACRLLAQESNEVHSRTGKGQMAEDAVLEAAGHLCAVHLCGGTAGFALTVPASDNDFPYIGVMGDNNHPALDAAGRRKLFRSEGPERIVPVHRTLAEYLAARYLVELVRKGLPVGRVVSLLTGFDLGVLSEMRGLFAWLACLCPEHSSFLLGRDPLGVVLYGDPAALPGPEKVRLFEELAELAQRDPWFRSENWTAAPFGALAVSELRPVFRTILEDSNQPVLLVDCVLDALAHGQSMPEFGDLLLAIIRDPQRPSILREDALVAHRNTCPTQVESLLDLLSEIQEGRLWDPNDNLRGHLLEALFPEFISLRDVLTYLVEGKANYFGSYWKFLHSGLLDRAGEDRLPDLLDILAEEVQTYRIEARGQRFRDFIGQALLRSLESLATKVPIFRLYSWLGVPLLPSGISILEAVS